MGKKGEKRTRLAKDVADDVVGRLAPLGEVRSRGMFGGYGVFEGSVMFGLVNAAGAFHLRVDDTTRARFVKAGASQLGKMPYFTVHARVFDDPRALCAWADEALAVARRAKAPAAKKKTAVKKKTAAKKKTAR